MNPFDVSISKHAPIETVRSQLHALAGRLADEWFVAQSQNNFAYFYLYYRKSKPGAIGQLFLTDDTPEGFELADAQRISPGWTRDIAYAFIHASMQRLPILAHETEPFPSNNGKPYTCVRVSQIDTPSQGVLYSARVSKKKWWKEVQRLREKIKANPLWTQQSKLDLIEAESRWRESQYYERQALSAIEKRANELGLTTQRPKQETIK